MTQQQKVYFKQFSNIADSSKAFISMNYVDGYNEIKKKGHAVMQLSDEDINEIISGGFEDIDRRKYKYFPINKKSDIKNGLSDYILVYFKFFDNNYNCFYGKMYVHKRELNNYTVMSPIVNDKSVLETV